jgi:type IV pilus assembly protein PilM
MLSFVQSWFNAASSPIGVDFGSDCLRMAQVEQADREYRLVAAASADVPAHVRNDPAARFAFFGETVRELLASGSFRGRRVMLNLPASMMYIQHLRLPKMDDEALKKALPWEARGKLPIDPTQAVLRHIVAGEIYHDQEPKYEVILMAARRDWVEQYLAAAAKARLDVAGMNVEPKSMLDCFSHIFRRKTDMDATTCFLDVGCTASRAVIARSGRIQFARVIPIGGEHFSRAVSAALQIPLEDARLLRIKIAASQPVDEPKPKRVAPGDAQAGDPIEGTGFALLNAAVAAAEKRDPVGLSPATTTTAAKPRTTVTETPEEDATAAGEPRVNSQVSPSDRAGVEQACREPLSRLVEELALCRRYYEATFPNQPVERLMFVGGEARQRALCQSVAREIGVAAQIGDPLARMVRQSEVGIESGIDRRSPQPAWAIAVGLSVGPAGPQQQAK